MNTSWFMVGFQLGQAACAAWENPHSNLHRLYERVDASERLNELAERTLIPAVVGVRAKLAARRMPEGVPIEWL